MSNTLHIYWRASRALLRAEAINEGQLGLSNRETYIPLEELTPQQRSQIVPLAELHRYDLICDLRISLTLVDEPLHYKNIATTWYTATDFFINKKLSNDELLETAIVLLRGNQRVKDHAERMAEKYEQERQNEVQKLERDIQERFDRHLHTYNQLLPDFEKLIADGDINAMLDALAEDAWPQGYPPSFPSHPPFANMSTLPSLPKMVHNALRKILEKDWLEDKAAWIAAHGSQRLVKGFAAGYACDQLYAQERATWAFSDAVVYINNNGAWKDVTCPSLAALNRLEEIKEHAQVARTCTPPVDPRVVFVGYWPTTETKNYTSDYHAGEAIAVEHYLDRYTLLIPIHE